MGAVGLARGLIEPDWAAPVRVRAAATTRSGGVSPAPWASLNLGDHVGDNPQGVVRNRRLLRNALGLAAEPAWLQQVHGTTVVDAAAAGARPAADASWTTAPGVVCAVLTADCLPVLFCNRAGTHVAAAHAGWRGLAAGVLESTVGWLAADGVRPDSLLAWLGPAIGPASYEVGGEVRDAFLRADPAGDGAFRPTRPGHWLLDLYAAARLRLRRAGVTAITGGDYCTLAEPERFFSHRRDGVTGRQATLIWLEKVPDT
ncbi:MAG: peptidoglycan editing factor PgeF [Gammaproteobacteria bacterium]